MRQPVEKAIIDLLKSGPKNKSGLIQAVQEKTTTTPQGIYKALRLLRQKEVITMQKKTVSLSLTWLDEQLNSFSETIEAYQRKARTDAFLNIKPGRSTTFKFRTLRELDTFWVDTLLLEESQVPLEVPMYVVIPHDWFSYLRPSTDQVWTRRLAGKRYQGIVITHALPFDKEVSREREAKELEFMFNQNPLKLDEKRYINIVGPWIFEAMLDATANGLLTNWIRQHASAPRGERAQLDLLLDLLGNYSLKITNSQKRADKLVKKLEKYFSFTLSK